MDERTADLPAGQQQVESNGLAIFDWCGHGILSIERSDLRGHPLINVELRSTHICMANGSIRDLLQSHSNGGVRLSLLLITQTEDETTTGSTQKDNS